MTSGSSDRRLRLTAVAFFAVLAGRAGAEPLVREADFAPPPVPAFMLKKPEQPLTLEEMQRQADAAAARVRRDEAVQPERRAPPPPGRDEAAQ